MKMRIIFKKKIRVDGLWTLTGTYSAYAYAHVYAYKEWWQRRYHFDIQLYIPYIEKPFYNGEFSVNIRLDSIKVQLGAEMEQLKDMVERRYNRYIILHKKK